MAKTVITIIDTDDPDDSLKISIQYDGKKHFSGETPMENWKPCRTAPLSGSGWYTGFARISKKEIKNIRE